MKKEPKVFLEHINNSINHIEKYIASFSYEQFSKNSQLQDAVVRRLEIIGEATKNLPEEFRKKYPEIPWKLMAGTRDVMSHEYFGIDFIMIWNIIKKELPELKIKIFNLLESLN
ncbi:DUF86 domain-containing protein [Candidatus Peregrinibacteria bacterium]|nr:DUF86 domain-containing protein [Candidatus Peregrinibacteria bacterium]